LELVVEFKTLSVIHFYDETADSLLYCCDGEIGGLLWSGFDEYFVAFAFAVLTKRVLALREKLRFEYGEFWRAELLVGSSAAILWPSLRLGKRPEKRRNKICFNIA